MDSSLKHQIGETYRGLVSFFSSSSGTSKFASAGTLTPLEFVAAGDQLTFKFPTWQWSAAKPGNEKSHLPKDKQFLITKRVPCLSRVRDLDKLIFKSGQAGAEDWSVAEESADERAPKLDIVEAASENTFASLDAELGASVESDQVRKKTSTESDARSYDLSITWDKYYQTPRLWLFGYNSSGAPLTDKEICQDILSEYIAKTVTVDPHPSTGLRTVSIHPCQHAAVMLKVVQEWQANGQEVRPDLALFVFLKFISGVVPTVNYDFTMDIDM